MSVKNKKNKTIFIVSLVLALILPLLYYACFFDSCSYVWVPFILLLLVSPFSIFTFIVYFAVIYSVLKFVTIKNKKMKYAAQIIILIILLYGIPYGYYLDTSQVKTPKIFQAIELNMTKEEALNIIREETIFQYENYTADQRVLSGDELHWCDCVKHPFLVCFYKGRVALKYGGSKGIESSLYSQKKFLMYDTEPARGSCKEFSDFAELQIPAKLIKQDAVFGLPDRTTLYFVKDKFNFTGFQIRVYEDSPPSYSYKLNTCYQFSKETIEKIEKEGSFETAIFLEEEISQGKLVQVPCNFD